MELSKFEDIFRRQQRQQLQQQRDAEQQQRLRDGRPAQIDPDDGMDIDENNGTL